MKIKNLFYLAVIPLSIIGVALSYKFASKKPNKGKRSLNKEEISECKDIFRYLEDYGLTNYGRQEDILFTSYDLFFFLESENNHTFTARQIGAILSKLEKLCPQVIHKKRIGGKEIRINKGYVWVYKGVNLLREK